MYILIGIVSCVVGCWLGYQFCMAKYHPTLLLKLLDLHNKHLMDELKTEDLLNEMEKLEEEYSVLKKNKK